MFLITEFSKHFIHYLINHLLFNYSSINSFIHFLFLFLSDNHSTMSTVRVSRVPSTATAGDLLAFFSTAVGSPAVASDIPVSRRGWLPRTSSPSGGDIAARVQFEDADGMERAVRMFRSGELPPFGANELEVCVSGDDVVPRASDVGNRVKEGGLIVGNRQEMNSVEVIQSWDGVRVEIIPERARIDIYFEDEGQKYKLEVFFQDIISSSGCKVSASDASDAILLALRYAPRIYTATDISKKSWKYKRERYYTCTEDLQSQSQSHWIRSPDFTHNSSFGKSNSLLLTLKRESSYSNILKSLPFRAEIGDLNIFQAEQIASSSNCIELYPLLEIPSEIPVPYEILFQLNSLVHMHKVPSKCVNADLLNTLSRLSVDICMKILKRFHKLEGTCYDPVQFVKLQFSEILRRKQRDSKGEGRLMNCYRVLITPTKVYLQGPELENSNYIVKHYAKYSSDFIRVTFVDEDWSKLPFNSISTQIEQGVLSKPIKTGIHARILSVLKNGFKIGWKKFEFLAFSASQLRGNSIWMFASNKEVTAANIRDFMGQFANIHSISKCAARMGQLFSSSSQTIDVPFWEVKMIPDIEISTNGNKYNFSDGIGKISFLFARQISEKLGLSHTPSAFQIRYGGFKGVVAVDRTSFAKLSLRASMKKFESQNTMLNITKFSTYQTAYLNREIITLLSTLGIEDEVFDEMQREHLGLLNDIFSTRESALKTVRKIYGGYSNTVVNMLTEGYEPCLEPYLFMVLKAQRDFQLVDIKSKCRIIVPKGRVLVGCLDEIGKLEYGQVYVRVTLTKDELREKGQFRNFDGNSGVVVGKVVVTKNPCLHPGDVRVLDAVFDASLDDMGLVDCVVFPQKGERPHPNECSGGDLDGDLYFISWDERLIPQQMDPPMDYSGPRQRIMDHDVTLEEIQNFFVDYMINDNLGAISTAHLVHADCEPLKARSPKCLELAQLHSMSVDFAKTGSPAEMPRTLRPKEFPDFMERYDRPMYRSTAVLGTLYKGFMSYIGSVNSVECKLGYYDTDLEVEGFESYLEDAEQFYSMYDEKFSNLMCYYKAEKEEEIVTGNLANKALYLKKDNKQYGELKDRILVAFKSLQREAEGWFKNSCSANDYSKMASAWYHVTYHPDFNGSDKKRYLSFAWVNSDVLLGIKANKRHKRKLDELLEEGMSEQCDVVT